MDAELIFDPEAFELWRNGEIVEIEPQALTVAAYLIEHRHRLIPKEELLDEVWGDQFVSESALSTRIKEVRRAVGDSGAEQRVIKTIRGKGFRFIGTIVLRSQSGASEAGEFGSGRRVFDEPLQNLPRLRTAMIGRDAQVMAAAASIDRHRLTTLVGVGGVGKTTLATAVGHSVLEAFPDGVWFVDLIPVRNADELLLALSKAAGLTLGIGPPLDQISRIFNDRQMLFILDNCESALESATSIVDDLLGSTSSPRFLLTSREPLGLHDEARIVLDTLATAGPSAPAVELFMRCADRYGVADLDLELVGDVCRELDGLPLAIELAAAQLRHLSLDDLASRLDRRFDLLVVPRSDRHASLATILESSWAAISHPDRELLRQLAVTPSALGLDGVIAIMDQPEDTTLASLARLVDCSLLNHSGAGRGHYRMLESVRVFARDNDPDNQSERRDRLAAWCLDQIGTEVTTHAFDFEIANWCTSHDHVIDAVEAHLASDRPHEAAMLIASQGLAMHIDDGSRAADILARIELHLACVDDPDLRARLHISGAFSAMAVRDNSLLERHGTSAVSEARHRCDPSILGIALVLKSWSAVRNPDDAIRLVSEAAAIAEAAGERRTLNLANGYRAWHLALMRRYDEAVQVASSVVAEDPADAGYDTMCAAAALATCLVLSEPDKTLQVYKQHLDRPGPSSMMANELLLASAHAANAEIGPTAEIVLSVHQRLQRSGRHALPDVLIPISILANALGDAVRARDYLSAVRHSKRATQSLQITCLYRQLREQLRESTDTTQRDAETPSADEVGQDALDWIARLADAT